MQETQDTDRIIRDYESRLLDRWLTACREGTPIFTHDIFELKIAHVFWEAMERIIEVGTVHPDTQINFLRAWGQVSVTRVEFMSAVEVETFIRALRILLKPYDGPDRILYRGQTVGISPTLFWSDSEEVAHRYARWREWPIILMCSVPSEAIISAPVLYEVYASAQDLSNKRLNDREFIVDPRGLQFDERSVATQPIDGLLQWQYSQIWRRDTQGRRRP